MTPTQNMASNHQTSTQGNPTMRQPFHLAAMAISVVAGIFLLVGGATVRWLTNSGIYIGLFQLCNDLECGSNSPTDSEITVRFFVIVSFLLCAAALVISIIYFVKFVKKNVPNKKLPFVAAIEFFVSGACAVLGCIIYAAKVKDEVEVLHLFPLKISYSFALTLVGGLMTFGAGALVMIQRNRM